MITYQRDHTYTGLETCNYMNCNHNFPMHFHDNTYTFSYMVDGGTYWSEKRQDFVKPGDIAVFNPGQIHSGTPYNNSLASYKNISITKSLVKELVTDLFIDDDIEFTDVICNEKHKISYLNMFGALTKEHLERYKEEMLLDFLYNIIKSNANTKVSSDFEDVDDKRIINLIDLIKSDLSSKLQLNDLSKTIGLSKFHLLRSFKKVTGLTPNIYKTVYRLEESKKLLINGLTIVDVGLNLGFTDQSHFSKTFKRYYGITPRQFIGNR